MKAGSPIHRQDRVKAYVICRILPVMWKFTVLPFQACTVSKEFTKDSKRKQNNNNNKKKWEEQNVGRDKKSINEQGMIFSIQKMKLFTDSWLKIITRLDIRKTVIRSFPDGEFMTNYSV